MNRKQQRTILTVAILSLAAAVSAAGQSYTTTVAAGSSPSHVAVNPLTNTIYVANANSNNVTVIKGATNTATTVTDPNANSPDAIAANPVSNKVYVANFGSSNVTVIDGATNATTTVSAGSTPYALAVNPLTNMIYVANIASNNVTVINGATNATTTISTGSSPAALAVNPVTNTIYVANDASGTVSVINGATNTVSATVSVGVSPAVVAVNPVTNKIYVSNLGSSSVSVIDGSTNTVSTTVGVGGAAYSLAVNPVSNKIYAPVADVVSVIDGSTNTVTPVANDAASDAIAVAVDPVANKIYVANAASNNVSVIDGVSGTVSIVSDPNANQPGALATNPVTGKVYITNAGSNNVSVFDGANYTMTTVNDPNSFLPSNVAVNPVTNTAYITNSYSGTVTVITGNAYTTTVTVGSSPEALAVNPATNKIYVVNYGSNNVTVIDGTTNTITAVTDPNGNQPSSVAVNTVTNTIYVANNATNNVTVIDGATDSVLTTVTDPNATGPVAVAVNEVTNTAYVVNSESGNVTVISGVVYSATVAAGTSPTAVAVNPVTNMIYVANAGSNNVTVINGATNATNTVTDSAEHEPVAIAVNPLTNLIYVANFGANSDFPAAVTVINGATNAITDIDDANADGPTAIAVNPATNKIYVANYNVPENGYNTVMAIDGATNSFADISISNQYAFPTSLAVNPVTGLIYVADSSGGDSLNTVIAEQQVQTIPIMANVTALTNNQTASVTPTFNFTSGNPFTTGPIDSLLFQADSWQSPWTAATAQGGGNFTGTTATLQPGFHILYTYATDGEEGTSTNTGLQSSPLIGNIAAYGFLVTAPEASVAPSSVTYGSQGVGTSSTAQAVTVSNRGSAPLVVSSITFTGTDPGDFSETDNCLSSPVAAAGTCIISVTFTPTAVNDRSATLVVTDNNGDVAGSHQTVTLTGNAIQATTTTAVTSSADPSVYGQTVTYTATITPQGLGAPGGAITFYDGTSQICVAVAVSSNQATCSNAILVVGSHSVTAVYGGDANFAGSTSAVLTQTENPAGTSTTLISSANPSVTGQAVTFTATVIVAAPGAGTVAGGVTFNNGATPLCTNVPLASGQAQCSSSNLALGTDTITAAYGGNSTFQGSTSSVLSQRVGVAATTTRITASTPSPSVVGQGVNVSFTVTVNAPGSGTIPGTDTVSVADSTGASCTATLATGACTLAAKAAGADTLTATYGGDANFAGSVSTGAPQAVNPAATTTRITSNIVNPSVAGQPVTVSFAVAVSAPGSGTIPGTDTVSVVDSTGASCTTTVGTGACTLTPKATGADTLTATYAGDTNFSPSTSPGAGQTVNPASTTTAIGTVTPAAPALGQALTVSYSVVVNSPGSGTIPGTDTVTVADGTGVSCTATVAAGKCSLIPKALGSDSLTATFNGDANFSKSSGSTSTSLTILQTVNLTGLSATTSPDQPTSLGISLNSAATTQLNGTLTLTFTSNASGTAPGYIDPMTCFINSSSQCVTQLNFTIPAGATAATLPNSGAVQQGTTAGTITVTLTSLTAGGTSVLPQPAPSLSVVVPPVAPVLKSVSITNVTSTGFDVVVTAYSTPRDLQNVTFNFTATSGDDLHGSSPPAISLSTVAQTYFSSASGASGGGTFVLTVPFSYGGNAKAIGSVTATLANSVGTSTSLTGNVQ